jgi:hypothetical protein
MGGRKEVRIDEGEAKRKSKRIEAGLGYSAFMPFRKRRKGDFLTIRTLNVRR